MKLKILVNMDIVCTRIHFVSQRSKVKVTRVKYPHDILSYKSHEPMVVSRWINGAGKCIERP